MIWRFLFLVAVMAMPVRAFDEQQRAAFNKRAQAQIGTLSKSIAPAAEVSVYLLASPSDPKTSNKDQYFSIKPGTEGTRILKAKVIKGPDLLRLKKAWGALATSGDYQAMRCHFPAYGLRFRDARGRVLVETTICFMCNNYYFRTTDGNGNGVLPERDSKDFAFPKMIHDLFPKP